LQRTLRQFGQHMAAVGSGIVDEFVDPKLVFGAILSVLLSRNRSCTDPVGEVWMRSLCTTRAPTVSVVVEPPGGVLSVAGLTAVAVPTCCAMAGAATARTVASVKMMDLNFPTIAAPKSAALKI
jgi:hypothetical protein